RTELQNNNAALRNYFAGKGLDFVYVANYDQQIPDKWKKLIGYFNLEGMQFLASKDLTNDILKKVNGTGFPTYVIIHKNGTYEISKAGYPMNRDTLIKQIEAAL